MKRLDEFGEKLQLEYPCAWVYKVVGFHRASIENAISEIIQEKTVAITLSNQSRNQKYIALNLEVIVDNEAERNAIYIALKAHAEIKMVL